MSRIAITVTQDDINQGCPASAGNCPIARAASRTFVNYNIAVNPLDLVLIDQTEDVSEAKKTYKMLPATAVDFIRRYDRYGASAVEPFTFTVEV